MGSEEVRGVSGSIVIFLMALNAGVSVAATLSLNEKARRYDQLIEERHIPAPQNLIVSVVFDEQDSEKMIERTDLGDAPIWTAYYLAAASYRYAATGEERALLSAQRALSGLEGVFAVTGVRGLAARYYFPKTKTCGDLLEGRIYGVEQCYLGDISRDQYIGILFGLGIASDLLPPAEQERIKPLIADIFSFLEKNDWRIRNTDGVAWPGGVLNPEWQYIFGIGSADHILAAAKLHDRILPEEPVKYRDYAERWSAKIDEIYLGTSIHYGYFAFNLHFASLFNLARWETDQGRRAAFLNVLRRRVYAPIADHHNILFEMMLAALENDAERGRLAGALLGDFPDPPRRNFEIRNYGRSDLRTEVSIIGVLTLENKIRFATDPLPFAEQPPTDFLWQRTPYALDGGGDGRLEYPGVDYLIAYWMGRYYGYIDRGQ
jgi:hypothetical protein